MDADSTSSTNLHEAEIEFKNIPKESGPLCKQLVYDKIQ
jgi:hypothetical protein